MPKNIILVIEDEKAISELITDCLTDEGYNVVQAYNAKEALDFLAIENCDLIIMDLGLPGIDGNRLLELVPARLQAVPVIMVTATPKLVRPNPRIKLLIPKPFDLDRLVAKVCELVPAIIDQTSSSAGISSELDAAAGA